MPERVFNIQLEHSVLHPAYLVATGCIDRFILVGALAITPGTNGPCQNVGGGKDGMSWLWVQVQIVLPLSFDDPSGTWSYICGLGCICPVVANLVKRTTE
jgi:hypothetical protein